MFQIIIWHLCTLTFFSQAGAAFLPSFLRPCGGPEITECWRQNIEDSRPYLIAGIEALQVPSIDPIYIPKLSVTANNPDVAVYDMQFKNILLTGAKSFQILDSYIDPLSLVIKLKLRFPKIVWSSHGRAEGVVFSAPINGTFKLDAIFTNLVLDLVLDGEEYASHGKNFVDWKRGSTDLSYESVQLTISDILREPEKLKDLNDVINESPTLTKPHIKPLIENTLGSTIIKILNRVHGTFSRDELFPKQQ